MGKIIFITGGCRSGKSAYAQNLAESVDGIRLFIATCPSDLDSEMNERIERHRKERGDKWENMEEPFDLQAAIMHSAPEINADVILVDCLTLWVSNLMHRAFLKKTDLTETDISGLCSGIIMACAEIDSTVIFVSNETGMGIVPENRVARDFRDLVGRCNQIIASASEEAFFMVSGIALKLK